MLLMYSDDLLMAQDEAVLPLMSSLVLAACAVFGYPISWKKLQMGAVVTWIGWELHFSSGSFCIPQDKLLRLEEMLQSLLHERRVKKKDLEKVIGVIQWMLQCHPVLRPFLTPLYLDMNRPLGTLFSVNPGDWKAFCACADEHAVFSSVPRGMAFSPGSRLLEARRVPIASNKDLLKVPVTSKRLWIPVADPTTSRRKLSQASLLFLQYWKQLSARPSRLRSLRHPPAWDVEAAADAHGSGAHLGIGGYFRVGTGPCFWFSEQWTVDDFAFTRLDLRADAQRHICCYEVLGQIALVHCLSAVTPGGRLFVRVPSWCDNARAESVNDKLFTSDWPLAAFVQRLAVYSVETGVELDVSHISGEKNTLADSLSCWASGLLEDLPCSCQSSFRIPIDLQSLWKHERRARIYPADAYVPWTLPARTFDF